MKIYRFSFIFLIAIITGISSCIKKAPLNAEADIVTATIDDAANLLQTNPVVGNQTVTFRLRKTPVSYLFAPIFTITDGATVSPASGTELDFSTPQQYTVTSQDGVWKKTYTVSFVVDEETILAYGFENVNVINTVNPEGHYDQFYDILPNGQEVTDWSSGNDGYNVVAASIAAGEGLAVTPEIYPTYQTDNGYVGKGVIMETRPTGSFGSLFGSPLAAGSLFIGDFSLTSSPLKSTHFGQPYSYGELPKALKGYFKYKAGSNFIVNNAPSALTRDAWNAYAIIFEKTDTDNYLLGDHDFKDPRMVSVAKLDDAQRIETDTWTPFEIPFQMVPGKTFDPDKEYMFTIVFSSSEEGDLFNGAIGSQLWIDEVELEMN